MALSLLRRPALSVFEGEVAFRRNARALLQCYFGSGVPRHLGATGGLSTSGVRLLIALKTSVASARPVSAETLVDKPPVAPGDFISAARAEALQAPA